MSKDGRNPKSNQTRFKPPQVFEYPHSLTNGDGNGPRIPIILPRIGLTEIQAASEQLIPITPRTHLSHREVEGHRAGTSEDLDLSSSEVWNPGHEKSHGMTAKPSAPQNISGSPSQ
ncbi:type i inositol--trisphosphate 5-phosphatase 11 [Moniliophthora roreri]|nr:type i inositol--trisphosphate 5-phosphatase 11 [Moniliophthora roreri]